MNLLGDILHDDPAQRQMRAADFATALSASNDQPIPLDLIIHIDLRLARQASDMALIERECRRKASLLAPDRRIAGLVCSLGQIDDARAAFCQAAIATALDSFTHDRAAPSEQLLLFDLDAQSCPEPLLALGPSMEWIGMFTLPQDADDATRCLTRLARAGTALSPRASTIWLQPSASAAGQHTEDAVLATASETQQALYVLPLFAGSYGRDESAPDHRGSEAQVRARFAAAADAHGFERAAPGLYTRRTAHCGTGGRTRLTRLLDRLYDTDVVGIGPGALSRIDRNRFGNFASLEAFRTDLIDGGYGVGQGSVMDEAQVLVGNLLAKLAGGGSVDPAALAQGYRQLGEDFRRKLQATLLALGRANALALDADGCVRLLAAHDIRYDETCLRLRQLARAESAGRVVSFRAP